MLSPTDLHTAKIFGHLQQLTQEQAMERFVQYLRTKLEESERLSDEEVVVLTILANHSFLPSQVRGLPAEDIRLLLRKEWLTFLDSNKGQPYWEIRRHELETAVLPTKT